MTRIEREQTRQKKSAPGRKALISKKGRLTPQHITSESPARKIAGHRVQGNRVKE